MSNTHCILPWNHLATHPNGNVSLCCISEMNNGLSMAKDANSKILDLNNNKIQDIINSKSFCDVRTKMLNNIEPSECNSCYSVERLGGTSKRQYENKLYNSSVDHLTTLTNKDGSIDPNLEFIELRLGNICNLKCVTCNPNSSYLLKSEFKQLRDLGLAFVDDYSWVEKGQYDWINNDAFWQNIATYGKNLKTIYINGGEPTLITKHIGYLEKLIDSNFSKNIDLIYSINMTRTTIPFHSIWDKFKSVKIEASIDDIEHRNYFIRFPSKWSDVLKHLDELKEKKYSIQILQTVSNLNIYYIDEFASFFAKHYPNTNIAYNFVNYPNYFSPKYLPKELKELVCTKLYRTLPTHKFRQVDNYLNTSKSNSSTFQNFTNYLSQIESIRKMNYKDYFPEFSAIIGRLSTNE